MSNRRIVIYGAIGLLLSASISSLLLLEVYPLVTKTLITQNTVHHGDLVIDGTHVFEIESATYINDGNILVQDWAKLVLVNAVLKLNETYTTPFCDGQPCSGEPLRTTDYTLTVRDNAIFEANNSVISSTSEIHFNLYFKDSARATLWKTNMTEAPHLTDKSVLEARYSRLVNALSLSGSANLSIYDSELNEQFSFAYAQTGTITISNSSGSILWSFDSFNGTIFLDQTRLYIQLASSFSSFNIIGNSTFAQNSSVLHGNNWAWWRSNITRTYGLRVVHLNGTYANDAKIQLYDGSGVLLWSGFTNKQGAASISITYTDENFPQTLTLKVDAGSGTAQSTVNLFGATPIIMSVP